VVDNWDGVFLKRFIAKKICIPCSRASYKIVPSYNKWSAHLTRALQVTFRAHLAGTSRAHFLFRRLYKDCDRKSEIYCAMTQLGSRLRSSGDVAPVQTFTLNTEAAGSSETSVPIEYKTRCCMTAE